MRIPENRCLVPPEWDTIQLSCPVGQRAIENRKILVGAAQNCPAIEKSAALNGSDSHEGHGDMAEDVDWSWRGAEVGRQRHGRRGCRSAGRAPKLLKPRTTKREFEEPGIEQDVAP